MNFEFSLEPVLKVRKHEEKVEKQKLARKLNKKKDLNELKIQLKEELEKHLNDLESSSYRNVHDLQRYQQYVKDLHKKVKQVNSSLSTIKNAIEQQREKLADVHKKRHLMEKVKEEEKEIFLQEVSKKQRKVMDEVATQTFGK